MQHFLGREVVAKSSQGVEVSRGKAVAYIAEPSYLIDAADGTRVSWRADMVELVIDEQEVAVLAEELAKLGVEHSGHVARALVVEGYAKGGAR